MSGEPRTEAVAEQAEETEHHIRVGPGVGHDLRGLQLCLLFERDREQHQAVAQRPRDRNAVQAGELIGHEVVVGDAPADTEVLGVGPRVHGAHRHHEAQAVGAALKTSGCELIFRDNASGGRWDRPELHKLLSQLRKGDVLVVWTLDRLSRSLRDVLTIMERVQERHAGFRSLKEAVDTTTPAGRMMMQMVGAFAEFERAMLKERTKAGLDAARKEGRIGGRPPKLKPHQQQEIVTLVKQGKKTAADAARLFGVHPATVSRLLRRI